MLSKQPTIFPQFPTVTRYKYLGVIVDKKGSLTKQVKITLKSIINTPSKLIRTKNDNVPAYRLAQLFFILSMFITREQFCTYNQRVSKVDSPKCITSVQNDFGAQKVIPNQNHTTPI